MFLGRPLTMVIRLANEAAPVMNLAQSGRSPPSQQILWWQRTCSDQVDLVALSYSMGIADQHCGFEDAARVDKPGWSGPAPGGGLRYAEAIRASGWRPCFFLEFIAQQDRSRFRFSPA